MSEEAAAPVLPQGDRFVTITPNDHGGIIWIVSLLCMTYTLITYATRLFIKFHMLGVDDWVMTAAQLLAMGFYAATFLALKDGMGKSVDVITEAERAEMSRSAYSMHILFILTICMAKISVMFLFRRVFTRDMKNFWAICNSIAGVIALWGIGSAITLTAGCNSSTYMPPMSESASQCVGQITRWKVVMSMDIATELLFVLLPMYMVKDLQMSTNLKVRVVVAFGFRLPVAAFGLAFLKKLEQSFESGNSGVDVTEALIWQQVELGYSLMAATIPCIKSFIKSFSTGFGMEVTLRSTNMYGSDGSSNNQNSNIAYKAYNAYRLENMKRNARIHSEQLGSQNDSTTVTQVAEEDRHRTPPSGGRSHPTTRRGSRAVEDANVVKLRPENLQNSTVIYHPTSPAKENGSMTSDGSQDMIIRRDVQWDIRTDYVSTTS